MERSNGKFLLKDKSTCLIVITENRKGRVAQEKKIACGVGK